MKILNTFLPWIIFFAIFGHNEQNILLASGVAMVAHFIINKNEIAKAFVFDLGAALFFIIMFINASFLNYMPLMNNAYWLANLAMAAIAWISIVIQKPFTMQYASLSVAKEVTYSKIFKKINYRLSLIWAMILTLIVLPSLMTKYGWSLSSEVKLVMNIFPIVFGIWLTMKFPEWYSERAIKKRFNINLREIFNQNNKDTNKKLKYNDQKITNHIDRTTQVLIIGAGPVGLTTALLLQKHGIKTLIIENSSGQNIHPKARSVSTRTMEIFRRLNLEKAINAFKLPESQSWFGWYKTLQSGVEAKVPIKTDYASISPCLPASSAQPHVERVLLKHYIERGGEILFEHNVINIAQNKEQVQLKVINKNINKQIVLQGTYCVAADGAHSFTRKQLNIPMYGDPALSTNFSVFCEMDLSNILSEQDRFGMAYVVEKNGSFSMVLSIDGKNQWVVIFSTPGIEKKICERIFHDEYVKQKIYGLLGVKDLKIKLISKQAWTLGSQIASQFSVNRIFLAGDSIHQFTPTGGMGMNTGIGDADNLAWKIAYVLQDKISPENLQTYQTERLPVILDNMEWSLNNLKNLVKIRKILNKDKFEKSEWNKITAIQSGHINKSGIDLGYYYHSKIIAATRQLKMETRSDHYQPNIYPGARLPHFNLEYVDKVISSLDLIDTDFVLIAFGSNKNSVRNIDFKSIPTKLIFLGAAQSEYKVSSAILKSDLGFDGESAMWIRPDAHIAWVGKLTNQNDIASLQKVIGLLSK